MTCTDGGAGLTCSVEILLHATSDANDSCQMQNKTATLGPERFISPD